jgi:hypothetical protein
MKVLVVGDSFAADWSVKHKNSVGWPNLLAKDFDVTNLAQAGVSEYKIYRQVLSVDTCQFDLVLIAHTSPYRVVTRKHPIHCGDPLHDQSDLISGDVAFHASRVRNWLTPGIQSANAYFKHHFDIEYHETIYKLLRKTVEDSVVDAKKIVIDNFRFNFKIEKSRDCMDLCDIRDQHPGILNHLSSQGNEIVHARVLAAIRNCVLT